MFKCIKCGKETKVKNWLCLQCRIEKKRDIESKNGLTDNGYDYHYNMIKWRIAETLIQELFLACNFDVYHYGMENTIPWIMELLYGIDNDVTQDIRKAPDFVVHKRKTDDFYFVEVKFVANWNFSMKGNIDSNYPYHNAYFIIVSKQDIKCLSYEELKAGETIDRNSEKFISSREEFKLDKDIVEHFRKFAIQFFDGVGKE